MDFLFWHIMNPRLRYHCPMCGNTYHPGNCAIVSSRNILQDQPVQPDHQRIKQAHKGPLARLLVTPLDGPKMTYEQAARICPHCDRLLPDNDIKNLTIAIVGDLYSGKTLFIASCLYQLLQKDAARMIGLTSIRGLGDTNERYYNEYYKPVYIDKLKRPATQPGDLYRPLIYELGFIGKPSVNLLFYDASGEDIHDTANMTDYGRFVLNASAIIFLADPMQMDNIVKTLPSHLKPDQSVINTMTSAQVLERVMFTFKRNNKIRPGKKIETPIAITLSKSDLLKFVNPVATASALYMLDSQYTNQIDTTKFDYVSQQVAELINDFGDSQLLLSSKQFQNVCFFAVSATGWSPNVNGEFPPLEPKRCLDPLLWTLWKLDLINFAGN